MKKLTLSSLQTYEFCLIRSLKESTNSRSTLRIHTKLLKSGSLANPPTSNHLINAYIRSQTIPHAHRVFDEMPEPNVVSWTSLMAGYIAAGHPIRSLNLFHEMLNHGADPNSFTIATAITACSHLADTRLGIKLHALVETLGLRLDLVVSTSLIGLYGKSNNTRDARKIFDAMVRKNTVTWCSMVSSYAQNALGHEALSLFAEFLLLGLHPNQFMLSSVVNACASTGRFGAGRSVHAAIVRHGHEGNDVIMGALIDMYAKCGCVEYSTKVFDRIEIPSLVPYTSMIVAAAKYGLAKFALELFDKLIEQGVKPNEVTFLGVLHACSHSGLVDTGLYYLDAMHLDHGIMPSAKHYTSVVDMLGRAGRLDEAFDIAKRIEAKGSDGLMLWSALVSASRMHRRLDLAVEAGKQLAGFEQDVAGAYVAMSNAYVSAGEWEGAARVRSEMRRRGIRKEPGCSWVEVKDVAYVFYAGEVKSCPRGREVVALLRELEVRMEERGCLGVKRMCLVDELEEEEVGVIVGVHSERLALGFALLSVGKGVTIRVMKNLRMCGDCHEVFKGVSEILGREFVVRDLNRFHHFRNGCCTCKDYW